MSVFCFELRRPTDKGRSPDAGGKENDAQEDVSVDEKPKRKRRVKSNDVTDTD